MVCLVIIFPIFIYFIYGRESKIDYDAIYEREPPTDSKPSIVNALLRGAIGIPDMDGFTGTIMDLVNRNYINLRDTVSENKYTGLFKSEKEDVLIEITGEGNVDELLDFELDAYNLLKKHAPSGTVSWSQLTSELSKGTEFYNFMNSWYLKVTRHVKMNKLFISKGNTYIYIFCILSVILGYGAYKILFSVFSVELFPVMANIRILFMVTAAFVIALFIFAITKQRSFGKWTVEGRLFQKRWDNFRKYLTDFSALKEHPPESVKIWDFYMVYAVSLGVAEKVIENMALVVPTEQFRRSRFYTMHHNKHMFHQGFKSAAIASAPDHKSSGSSSGVRGAGGGFGGGGGGAR